MDNNYTVVGIDQSLSSTGVAVLFVGATGTTHSTCAITPKTRGVVRLIEIEQRIKAAIPTNTAIVLLEGYAYQGHGAVFSLGELGGTIKLLVHRLNLRLLIVPPTTLKKYVIGSGIAPKSKMLLGVYKKWGVEFDTDDEADSYALARIGELIIATESGVATTKLDKQVYDAVIRHTSLTLEGVDHE